MAGSIDRQRAKELVAKIARDHGYLGDDVLREIEPESRRKIEEALLNKDRMIGSSVITLATNLYTNKARFIFELLQNADDNRYSKARESGAMPFVSFHVFPKQIVVDCNEDGFTEENLEAICSVGKSSKKGAQAQGYIGEKGIGFKSVFMAAWKVHIQSGAFSFSFTHKPGESGMGMISPVWEETQHQSTSPLTRITLHLRGEGDADVLAKTQQTIYRQFQDLQETVLLFMRNLQRIDVSFYDDNQSRIASTTYSVDRSPDLSRAILRKETGLSKVAKHFHVTKHTVHGLARNENRTYSEDEEAKRVYSTSEVVLAFPLSEDDIPIVEPQDLFVFLPVRKVGFSFIIQADFVTDANRQDIVQDSLRNGGLLEGIAQAFGKAMLQLQNHQTLRYQWMRYLPERRIKSWDKLWAKLVDLIAQNLNDKLLLCDYTRSVCRHPIKSLLRLADDYLDETGQPLLGDGEPSQTVSQSYTADDLDRLGEYGLGYATLGHFLDWLRQDLQRGIWSRMKSARTLPSWHTKVARLLCRIFEKKLPKEMQKLKDMSLLPLQDGKWASASSGPVYFAQSRGHDIPSDIGLQLISKDELCGQRTRLFQYLGVVSAPVTLVRDKILERGSKSPVSLQASKCHLQFLYLTDHLQKNQPLKKWLSIHANDGKEWRQGCGFIYFANDDPYGPRELSRKTEPGPNPGDGAPGYPVRFVNEAYFEDPPEKPKDQPLTWLEWFYEAFGVERCLHMGELVSEEEDVGKYILRHRPEKFLAALREWYEHGLVTERIRDEDGDFIEKVRAMEVLCRGGKEFVPLKDVYFPTADLESRVERFVEPNAFFPWLWLDDETVEHDAIPTKWKRLLKKLRVGSPSTDGKFAMDMLRYSIKAFPENVTAASQTKLFRLYSHIQTTYRENRNESFAGRAAYKYICRAPFEANKYIYIPPDPEHGRREHTWASYDECVWDAPLGMKTKYALEQLYQPCFDMDAVDATYLSSFFTSHLRIARCTWQIYVEELKCWKTEACHDHDFTTKIYFALKGLLPTLNAESKSELKDAFDTDALIYCNFSKTDEKPSWYKVSQCVWSGTARLRDRISLNDSYADLKELFVDFLGVKPIDLSMAIDELKKAARRKSTTVSEIKDSIWTVNSLLNTDAEWPPFEGDIAIFPVQHPDGNVTREPRVTEFFLVDREPVRQLFEKKVKFLNFGLKDVAKLDPFLKWTSLKTRCLSHCVREVTSVPDGLVRSEVKPKRQIKKRAHALLRVAAHFESPRTRDKQDRESFYKVLRNAQIYESAIIISSLRLFQDGNAYEVEGGRAALYIDEQESTASVMVYIPLNKDAQKYTFESLLPEKLARWMMGDSNIEPADVVSKVVSATRTILTAPLAMLDKALDDCGISTVDIGNMDNQDDGNDENSQDRKSSGLPTTPMRNGSRFENYSSCSSSVDAADYFDRSPGVPDTPATSVGSTSLARSGLRPRVQVFHSGRALFSTPSRLPQQPSSRVDPFLTASPLPSVVFQSPPSADENKYVALLGKVISSARRGIFPGSGRFDMSQLAAALPLLDDNEDIGTDFGLSSLSQIQRDLRVGAAGELYVFELLSHLWIARQLTEFSRANWKSKIRKYVRAHPEYADMDPWEGRETSDIVYQDSLGELTELLVDKGYLKKGRWVTGGRQPTYFIEVKTTTSSCETPFYMSKFQYQRMRDCTLSDDSSDNVYVIFRVYNLGRDDMGVRVYVDPEKLRLSGKLKFTAENWSIVPS